MCIYRIRLPQFHATTVTHLEQVVVYQYAYYDALQPCDHRRGEGESPDELDLESDCCEHESFDVCEHTVLMGAYTGMAYPFALTYVTVC